ncbi:dUTP diphosphatase [Desulfovibrio piger]|uniref:dUTP diphosphatase n=1 Tax=Desulfovibrio piger TaxID=901 RepID=UPI0026E96C79|nr:hypothetical protein [Desulfovibrio piger]
MQIKVTKIHPDAVLPQKAHDDDAGFDLTAVAFKKFGDVYVYDTGIALEIPKGYFGGVYARSSIFLTGMEKCGGVTVVDAGYRGSIKVAMRQVISGLQLRQMRGDMAAEFPGKLSMMFPYKRGDRIAQLIIQPCLVPTQVVNYTEDGSYKMPVTLEYIEFIETAKLSTTARGSGGYGSTGR